MYKIGMDGVRCLRGSGNRAIDSMSDLCIRQKTPRSRVAMKKSVKL